MKENKMGAMLGVVLWIVVMGCAATKDLVGTTETIALQCGADAAKAEEANVEATALATLGNMSITDETAYKLLDGLESVSKQGLDCFLNGLESALNVAASKMTVTDAQVQAMSKAKTRAKEWLGRKDGRIVK